MSIQFVTVSVCGRFGLWLCRFASLSVCGLFGLWSVCGHIDSGRSGLWPSWPETDAQSHRQTDTQTGAGNGNIGKPKLASVDKIRQIEFLRYFNHELINTSLYTSNRCGHFEPCRYGTLWIALMFSKCVCRFIHYRISIHLAVRPLTAKYCKVFKIGCYDDRIAFNFDRHLDGAATEVLSNFKAIRKVQTWISLLGDFTRSCGKTHVGLMNRSPVSGK